MISYCRLLRAARRALGLLPALLTSLSVLPLLAGPPTTRPAEGLRDHSPAVHALTGARVVVAPGRTLERATIVIREGSIEAVGEDLAPPADARVWDLAGKTVYAGFLDAYTDMDVPWEQEGGGGYWNEQITPQRDASRAWKAAAEEQSKFRAQGITVRLVAPRGGIIKGRSLLVTSGDASDGETIVRSNVAQHIHLTVPHGADRDQYPNSPMGAVALARQAFYDAQWYRQAHAAYQAGQAGPRPEYNEALELLAQDKGSERVAIADASNELFCLRADRFAREFSLHLILHGSGNEYRRLDAIRGTGRAIIVPLDFPKPPNVTTPEAALSASLEEMLHWDHAPENPARLAAAGISIAFTTEGLKELSDFLPALRKAVHRGLPRDAALRALTTEPAAWFGVADRLGTIEAGKAAHLVVTSGELFDEKTKVLATWIDGRHYAVDRATNEDCRGTWQLTVPWNEAQQTWQLIVTGEPAKLSAVLQTAVTESGHEHELKLDQVGCHQLRLSGTFDSEPIGKPGKSQISAVLAVPPTGDATALGRIVWPDGTEIAFESRRTAPPDVTSSDEADKGENDAAEGQEESPTAGEGGEDESEKPSATDSKPASFPVQFPLGAFGTTVPVEPPPQVLLTGATIWTCGPAGILEDASLLIGDGKILAVGRDLATPPGATVVDVRGKHITPGIIDCHSHMATDGGVNESGQTVTAEVRIGDFIDSDDINIYRQLAGGVTTANILHGSANTIGGQNQVIKLRWGMLPEQMKFDEAPPGIKFALGENVKQSNWGDDHTTRYPQTRMGVEQLIRDELLAAQQYQQQWQDWLQQPHGPPPRTDLELQAMAEVVQGKRWIHCHSYRQDEILALLRLLDEFKIQIGTLQHILEGYKVADEMARHGAMGSSFADWWAYKFEVYDAIPYNGALMHRAGVVVSFNSDDRELARHLNHEAAKATKYGGVPPEEALKFVTLNPARQLRIDALVGSLESGKHADLVVWNGPPLSTFSRCEQTWIDGRKFFDQAEDQRQRETARQMRATLVQKILTSGEKPRTAGEGRQDPASLWPRDDLFCHPHHEHHDDH